jgi:CBS domain-containing protein
MNTPGENSTDLSSIFFDYEITFGEQRIEDAIGNVVLKMQNNTYSDFWAMML